MNLMLSIATTLAIMSSEMQSEINAKLRAISGIESGDNDNCIGKAGERGRYQLTRAAWKKASNDPFDYAFDRASSYAAAYNHLTTLEVKFRKRFNRWPSPQETYAMWRLGYAGLSRRNLKVPASIKDSCIRYENLYLAYRQNQ